MTESAPPRPLVARPGSDRGVWAFVVVAAVGAALLFAALEARRSSTSEAALEPPQTGGAEMIVPPPPLAIPDAPVGETRFTYWPGPRAGEATGRLPLPLGPAARPAPIYAQPPAPSYSRRDDDDDNGPTSASPGVVYQAPSAPQYDGGGEDAGDRQRVRAGIFANPSTTIPQGAVIHAVLETAVDSTQPGAARAIVSRDVRSFDGSRVLVPRGSRLYGEYKADLARGQNRALIQWLRLMRPDGVTVALDSPSADTLGRAGIKGKLNTHFLERFGGALLQSALDIGVGLATRDAANGTVIVGLPGSTQSIVAPTSDTVRPTLKVAQGTPVSVFVARDLDFSEVER